MFGIWVFRGMMGMGRRRVVLAGLTALAVSMGTAMSAQVSAPVPRAKPAAPAGAPAATPDAAALALVFAAIEQRQPATARTYLTQIDGDVARTVAHWAILRSAEDTAPLSEIGAFLDAHTGWPDSVLLQQRAEKAMTDATPAADVLAFFASRDPVSGPGHAQLGRALIETGKAEAGRAQIRRAWTEHDWPLLEERAFLARHADTLTPRDHWVKADRQLFEVRATATERLVPLLPPERRREATVRIALLKQDRNAPPLLNALPPASLRDSGVLHAATRYYRRLEQETTALTYAGLAPLDAVGLRDPEAWYTERKLLARWAIKTGRFADAYTLSAYSGLSDGESFSEAEFLAGWTALRFLGDAERGKAHFAFLSAGVTSPISRARGEYWLGRAFAATGERAAAAQHYRTAAEYSFTFYGQLAIATLGKDGPRASFPAEFAPSAEDLAAFEARPLVQAMRMLAAAREHVHYDRFARALDDQLRAPGEVIAFHDMVQAEDKLYLAVRAAKVARNNGADVPHIVYPIYPVPERAGRYVEEALILGLSRQESEFNPRAFSSARARGMMQLIDATAKITAKKENIPYTASRLLDDPAYNLLLGAAHLSHLIDKFGGSYILTLVAYNAGPNRVDQWIPIYGDPRTAAVDPVDWIELIPFSETRNYVMRVLENTQVYRARLNGVPLGSRLMEDLVRGGNRTRTIGGSMEPISISFEAGAAAPSILNRPKKRPAALEWFDTAAFPPLDHSAAPARKPKK